MLSVRHFPFDRQSCLSILIIFSCTFFLLSSFNSNLTYLITIRTSHDFFFKRKLVNWRKLNSNIEKPNIKYYKLDQKHSSWILIKEEGNQKRKYDLRVGFNDTFKVDNPILSVVSGSNGRNGRKVRNFISKEVIIVLEIYKTLIRPYIEYCCQSWAPVARHGDWSDIGDMEIGVILE